MNDGERWATTFTSSANLGERITPQVANQWPPFVPADPPRSIFYVWTLSPNNMVEMKVGIHFVNFIDHNSEYATHIYRIKTHLAFLLLYFGVLY